jgi:putative methyltransferase (TIGR04325 family)
MIVPGLLRPYVRKARAFLARPASTRPYASYQDALSHCGHGYEDQELAEVMLAKTQMLLRSDLGAVLYPPFVNALMDSISASRGNGPVRVLDFGGSFGLYYFLCRQLASFPIRWAVVESETVANLGQALASDHLSFFSNLRAAQDWLMAADIIFANGAIQYTPDPVSVLSQLVELKAQRLLFLRTAIARGATQITIQDSLLSSNGPGGLPPGVTDRPLRYPRTFLARHLVYDTLWKYRIEELPRDDREPLMKAGRTIVDAGWCARAQLP